MWIQRVMESNIQAPSLFSESRLAVTSASGTYSNSVGREIWHLVVGGTSWTGYRDAQCSIFFSESARKRAVRITEGMLRIQG